MDYTPNSHKYKLEQVQKKKEIQKVVKGPVKTKKKSGLSKFTGEMISDDAENVGSYVIGDILIPSLKKAVVDIVTDGVRMIFGFGPGRGEPSRGSSSYVSYRSYSDDRGRDKPRERSRSGYSMDDIILSSRGEAEEVITQMDELIDMYDIVSVADVYDLVGIRSEYTDNNYGWKNIRNVEPIRIRDGYLLKFPKPIPIK